MASNVKALDDLTKAKYEKLIAALLSHKTADEACRAAGVSLQTLSRWMKSPVFLDMFRAARCRLMAVTIARLQALGSRAVATLEDVLTDTCAPATARVSAAKAALDLILRAHEVDQLEARLEALEAALKNQGAIEGEVVP